MKALVLTACSLLFTGCVAAPSGVVVVKDFDLERYLDNWYRIARPDHRFEHGG
jgi:apolipoprotein D and lipocalin family protein